MEHEIRLLLGEHARELVDQQDVAEHRDESDRGEAVAQLPSSTNMPFS